MPLWASWVIAPLLVLADLSLRAQDSVACDVPPGVAGDGLALLCLALVAGLTAFGWREMRRAEAGVASHGRHFLALLATEAGGLACLLIAALWLAAALMPGC